MKSISVLCLSLIFCVSILAQVPTNGLVAYYPFSGNPNDQSGNGYISADSGATLTTDRFGNLNSAYNFNYGTWIDLGDILNSVFESNTFSISIWYKPDKTQNGGLIYKWNNVYANTGNAFWYTPQSYTSNSKRITTFPDLIVGQWTHDVVVLDNGKLTLYRNGQLVVQDSGQNCVNSIGYTLQVGGDLNGSEPQYQFYGKIDDIRIYNRTLSAAEVLALYHEGGWTGPQRINIIPNPSVNKFIHLTNNTDTTYPNENIGDALAINSLWGIRSTNGVNNMDYVPSPGFLTDTTNLTNIKMDVNTDGKPNYIAGYPSIRYGYNPKAKAASIDHFLIFPMRLGSLANIQSYDHFWTVVKYNISALPSNPMDFAYDIWISDSSHPSSVNKNTIELMIWLDQSDLKPTGDSAKITGLNLPCLVNGQFEYLPFDVYEGNTYNGSGATVSFALENPTAIGSIGVDLSSIADTLISLLPTWNINPSWTRDSLNNYYMLDVELGSEFRSNSAAQAKYAWTISEYYFQFPQNISFPTGILNTKSDNPRSFYLSQNYPNPFNPTTTISYSLPRTSLVKITVYDILGREIKTLVNGQRSAGNYKVVFNASDFASGVYLYRMQAGSFVETKKLLLLK